jgi:SagB-type dehydrogenase family enzyme
VQSARRTIGVPASALVFDLLDHVDDWTAVEALEARLSVPVTALDVLIEGLHAHDLIEMEGVDVPGADLGAGPWATWSPTAELFHRATRDIAVGRGTGAAAVAARPEPMLAPRGTSHVRLPAPHLGETSLRAALRDRRTHRRFGDGPIPVQALATLLGLTFGVQAWALAEEGPLALKTSPSGGARHSLEAYVWVRHVDGVPAALYHYRPGEHSLTRLDTGRVPGHVTEWLPIQDGYEGAAVLVALTSELARVAWRYRSARAYRVVLLEAGHLAQTFCLAATALGLAPFCTAALADAVIEHDLGLDAAAQPVMYMVGAGRVATGAWQPHAGRVAPRLVVTALGKTLESRVIRRWRGPRRPRRRASGR